MEKYRSFVLDMMPTGSRVICNPPPMDTDEDWLVLGIGYDGLWIHNDPFVKAIKEDDFYHDYTYSNLDQYFFSFRNFDTLNPINIILTYNQQFYDLFREATFVAQEENLLRKEDRIACFEMIMKSVRNPPPKEVKPYIPYYTSLFVSEDTYSYTRAPITRKESINLPGKSYIDSWREAASRIVKYNF